MSLTDIAVLKSEVSGLHDAISEVGTKMDILLDMHIKLSVLQERSDQVMAELGRVRDGVNRELGTIHTKVDNVSTHSLHTRERFDTWLNRAAGGVVVGSLFLGIIQYTVLEKLDQLGALASTVATNSAHIDLLERGVKAGIVEFDAPSDKTLKPEQHKK